MTRRNLTHVLVISAILFADTSVHGQALQRVDQSLPSIKGKKEALQSPFVTAGNRVYMVGFQNGSFPDLGWHITGEMGGIWDHPIKLMDGFDGKIKAGAASYSLDAAEEFVNYPIGNMHQYSWKEQDLIIKRFQFVPDGVEGIVVEYEITNNSKETKELLFEFTGMVDLRPTWLGERTKMNDGDDELVYQKEKSRVIGKDKLNNWFTVFGSTHPAEGFHGGKPSSTRLGRGSDGTLTYKLTLSAGQVLNLPFIIAGSYVSQKSAEDSYEVLKSKSSEKLDEKVARYKELGNTAKLILPDKQIAQMYEWLKYNTDWLVREVPEMGTGLSAGLPDYPWWFGCDNTYALQGVLASGNHVVAKKTIELLSDMSQRTNKNGRILHEMSTNGAVYNPGNVNETAQFIDLVWIYYTWTGDKALVNKLYPRLKEGIRWLDEMDKDKNHYPNGSGMMEIAGLDTEMIDVAVYTQAALSSLAKIAKELNDRESASVYENRANDLKRKINDEWWSASSASYADFRATDAETVSIVDAAIVRADTLKKQWSLAELHEKRKALQPNTKQIKAQSIYHNWVVNTPLEKGIADKEKAESALKTSRKYENAFGVYVTGIDRSIEPDSVVLASRKKTFSYTGAVMTLPTGIQAIAAANYDQPDLALDYIRKLLASFSYALPGSMYEVSPDFGMFTQAWNIYGVAVPIIQEFLGIQPMAHKKTIIVSPALPTEWNDASVEHIKVGNNSMSLSISKRDNKMTLRILQSDPTWKIVLASKNAKSAVVNGKDVSANEANLTLTGGENNVTVSF